MRIQLLLMMVFYSFIANANGDSPENLILKFTNSTDSEIFITGAAPPTETSKGNRYNVWFAPTYKNTGLLKGQTIGSGLKFKSGGGLVGYSINRSCESVKGDLGIEIVGVDYDEGCKNQYRSDKSFNTRGLKTCLSVTQQNGFKLKVNPVFDEKTMTLNLEILDTHGMHGALFDVPELVQVRKGFLGVKFVNNGKDSFYVSSAGVSSISQGSIYPENTLLNTGESEIGQIYWGSPHGQIEYYIGPSCNPQKETSFAKLSLKTASVLSKPYACPSDYKLFPDTSKKLNVQPTCYKLESNISDGGSAIILNNNILEVHVQE